MCGCVLDLRSQVEGDSGVGSAPMSAEAELASRVNEMWFVEPGGEPLTFREVFLRSNALENIILGRQLCQHLLLSASLVKPPDCAAHSLLCVPCLHILLSLHR